MNLDIDTRLIIFAICMFTANSLGIAFYESTGSIFILALLLIVLLTLLFITVQVRTRHIKRTEEGEVRILLSFLQNILEALVIGSANSKELNNHIMNRKDTLNRGCAKEEGEK